MLFLFQYFLIVLSLFCLGFNSFSQYDSIPHDGGYRTYLVHLPTSYDGSEELPMVIAMHGGFGNAYNMQNMSQLSVKANQENFIVVYPEGVAGGALNISAWNAGWCCGYASNANIDDVGFIDALIDSLSEDLAIDLNRVYATGMSNGGFMSYRLACELSHKIAAIAPVSASMAMTSCSPNLPVPVIGFHSYLDTNVPYDGGQGDGASNHHNSPQDSVMNAWSALNNCQNENDTLIQNNDYLHVRWDECDCQSAIHYYITEDGGHSWHGGQSTIIGDDPSTVINANDLMWEFFSNYSLECGMLSVEEKNQMSAVKVYPNPTEDLVFLKFENEPAEFSVKVFSSSGKLLQQSKNATQISIGGLSKGVYFLVIDVGNERMVRKMVRK
jgi:polyhydroxybutyrate depolymerase